MALRTSLPVQPHLYIGDSAGRPLDYGMVYFGQPNKDPEFYPIDIYYDKDLSLAAAQPVRTKGGFLNANGDMTEIYASDYTYSVKVLDEHGVLVFYEPNMERVNISQDSQISTKLPYPDAIVRTQGDRNQDSVSAQDFGAIGNGIADDTNAFANLEKHYTERNIDLQGKTYKVSNTPTANTYANGFFSIAGIIHPSEFKEHELKFKKHCMQFITGNRYAGSPIPLIFGGSDNVFQGFCIIPQEVGNPKLYVTQRAYRDDGQEQNNWLARETYRIIEYEFKEDGSDVAVTQFSDTLSIGHGSALSYTKDANGQVWFYSGYPSDSDTVTDRSDKGFSRIKWRGAATNESDITYYQMFDYPEVANGVFPYLNRAAVAVSTDGKIIGFSAANTLTKEQDVILYDLDSVLNASVPKLVKPIANFPLKGDLNVVGQGFAIHNDKIIVYYDKELSRSAIKILDLNGNVVSDFDFETFRSYYDKTKLTGSQGVLTTAEGEGLFIYGNDIYISYRDYWSSISETVIYKGKYYAPRYSNTGIAPVDPEGWAEIQHWQEVESQYAAGAVAWDGSKNYTVDPATRLLVNKRIYKISSLGEASSQAIGATKNYVRQTSVNYGVSIGGNVQYRGGELSIIETVNGWVSRTVALSGATTLYSKAGRIPLTLDNSVTGDWLVAKRSGVNAFGAYSSGINTVIATRNGQNLYLGTYTLDTNSGEDGAHTRIVFSGSGDKTITPANDSVISLGAASKVFKDLYLQNAPIVSSDERLKQDFRKLKAAEKKAALEIKESICLYKMKDSVVEKGDGARWHVGVKAQQIVSIMESHGLEPFDYGFICHDEWEAQEADIDDDGNEVQAAREAGDKYAIRYDELAMFILAAI